MVGRHRFVGALLVVGATACSSSSSPTVPSSGGPTIVAVVGCSQTTTAWGGWQGTGDSRVWMNVVQGYGGGDIAEWSRTIPNGDYWSRLESNIVGNSPATAVWWQICDLAMDNGTLADGDAVLAEIRRRFPGPPCPSARSPTSSAPRPARSKILATPGGWSITLSRRAVPFADPSFPSCSTRGSSHPTATASATQVRPAARPSARYWRRSTGQGDGAQVEGLDSRALGPERTKARRRSRSEAEVIGRPSRPSTPRWSPRQ